MENKLLEKVWVIDAACGEEVGTCGYVQSYDTKSDTYNLLVSDMGGTYETTVGKQFVSEKDPSKEIKDIVYEHIKKEYSKKQVKYPRDFEAVINTEYTAMTRLKVPTGWIVSEYTVIDKQLCSSGSTFFVPDPKHEWVLEDKGE